VVQPRAAGGRAEGLQQARAGGARLLQLRGVRLLRRVQLRSVRVRMRMRLLLLHLRPRPQAPAELHAGGGEAQVQYCTHGKARRTSRPGNGTRHSVQPASQLRPLL